MRRSVVGHHYQGRRLCDTCIRPTALTESAAAGAAIIWGDGGTSDEIIGEWSSMLGIYRDLSDTADDTTNSDIDTSYFPARIFDDHAHTDCTPINRCVDRCGECGNPLGYDCPGYPEVIIT